MLYAVAKAGTASLDLDKPSENLQPLFETIISTIPAATGDVDAPLRPISTTRYFFGRIAVCRVFQGTLHAGNDVNISKRDGSLMKTRVTKLFTFSGLKRIETTESNDGETLLPSRVLKASLSAKTSLRWKRLRRCR